jgi:hypothetical protein
LERRALSSSSFSSFSSSLPLSLDTSIYNVPGAFRGFYFHVLVEAFRARRVSTRAFNHLAVSQLFLVGIAHAAPHLFPFYLIHAKTADDGRAAVFSLSLSLSLSCARSLILSLLFCLSLSLLQRERQPFGGEERGGILVTF